MGRGYTFEWETIRLQQYSVVDVKRCRMVRGRTRNSGVGDGGQDLTWFDDVESIKVVVVVVGY